MRLGETQRLILANPQQAEVVYEDGTVSFLVTAERVRDAVGTYVPTYLEVSGNVLTLKVEHRSGNYVYPIVAANYWETSYVVPVEIEKPKDEIEIKEREELEREESGAGEEGAAPAPPSPITPEEAQRAVDANMASGGITVAPPEPTCTGTCATASEVRTFVVDERHDCSELGCGTWHINLAAGVESERPHFRRGYRYSEWVNGTPLHCSNYYAPLWAASGLYVVEEGCGFAGPWRVFKEEDKHLDVWLRAHIVQPVTTDLYSGFKENYVGLLDWVWPNGDQRRVVRNYDPSKPEIEG